MLSGSRKELFGAARRVMRVVALLNNNARGCDLEKSALSRIGKRKPRLKDLVVEIWRALL